MGPGTGLGYLRLSLRRWRFVSISLLVCISCHWAPCWLILQITFVVYSEVVVSVYYLTIRLLALDFYAVIVDEGKARINYHRIEIESE